MEVCLNGSPEFNLRVSETCGHVSVKHTSEKGVLIGNASAVLVWFILSECVLFRCSPAACIESGINF